MYIGRGGWGVVNMCVFVLLGISRSTGMVVVRNEKFSKLVEYSLITVKPN